MPLCEILGISINELLSGEKSNKQNYQEKLEENFINKLRAGSYLIIICFCDKISNFYKR